MLMSTTSMIRLASEQRVCEVRNYFSALRALRLAHSIQGEGGRVSQPASQSVSQSSRSLDFLPQSTLFKYCGCLNSPPPFAKANSAGGGGTVEREKRYNVAL